MEQKRVSEMEVMLLVDEAQKKRSMKIIHTVDTKESIRNKFRDWLLGGETYNWSIHKDMGSGDIVLSRW